MAAQNQSLNTAERRIAEAVAAEVYQRVAENLLGMPETKLRKKSPAKAVHRIAELEESAPILARAIEVFGSSGVAIRWMREPNPSLRMRTPLQAIVSTKGRKEVNGMLGRIEHGVIS